MGAQLQTCTVHTLEVGQTAERRWRGHWLNVFGSCKAHDWASCWLSLLVPCWVFGRNSHRVLGLSLWREALRYALVLLLVKAAAVAASIGVELACGARAAAVAAAGAGDATTAGYAAIEADLAKVACSAEYSPLLTACQTLVTVCAIVWAGLIGGPQRRALQQRLGIPDGTPEGACCRPCQVAGVCDDDCCLHLFCRCCALAQETRTCLQAERAQTAAAAETDAEGRLALLQAPQGATKMARTDDPPV